MKLSEVLKQNPKNPVGFDLYDLRVDIERALMKAGIEVTGAGCGGGTADISINVDGRDFWIDIKQV